MTTPAPLPELSDERIAALEEELFARIADEPAPAPTQVATRARRGRVWLGALAGAAAVLVAVIAVPALVTNGMTSGSAGSAVAEPALTDRSGGAAVDPATGVMSDGSETGTSDAVVSPENREIIASGSATVRVDDVAQAIAAIGRDAEGRGGYVESTSTDGGGVPIPIDGTSSQTSPSGYITVRVPADQLAATTAALGEVGEVTASAVSQQDVTDQAIDLRARVESLEASVDRLTALLADAQSVDQVVAVESALSQRQADLESYRQQLQYLDGQVALSSLTVTVVPGSTPVTADPAGFGDGLTAGWNGLVATLNGIVVAVGFLLPWLGVAAIVAIVVWLIVRARRRRRDEIAPAEAAE